MFNWPKKKMIGKGNKLLDNDADITTVVIVSLIRILVVGIRIYANYFYNNVETNFEIIVQTATK